MFELRIGFTLQSLSIALFAARLLVSLFRCFQDAGASPVQDLLYPCDVVQPESKW